MADNISNEYHLVTGGGGYPGLHLAKALLDEGHIVRIIDIRKPDEPLPEGIEFIKVDISRYAEVKSALQGVNCVYHMASYGMSGRDQLNRERIEAVNVQGTENVVRACLELGIPRLVYTSTYNVVFGGQEIVNGDESLPYFPLSKQPDHYSRTKSIAEQIALKANGLALNCQSTTSGHQQQLSTCALRLAGVYGPGEQRHLPRIMDYVRRGLFSFTYGRSDSLVEFLHVHNLVQAHIRAGQALKGNSPIAAGQAYFISDCKPINNFQFFRPMIEELGYSYPTISLPLTLIYLFAFLTEILHSLVGRVYNFQPLLTRTEVYKTGVTHYFSNDKARTELGYKPIVQNDLTGVISWLRDHGYAKKKQSNGSTRTLKTWIVDAIIIGIFAAAIISFLPFVK